MRITLFAVFALAASSGHAAWTVTPRSAGPLAEGGVTGIAELSGVTLIATSGNTHTFASVQDTGNQLITFDVEFTADAALTSASAVDSLALSPGFDFEGAAYTNPIRNSLFLSEENTPAVHEYDLATGVSLQTISAPAVFSNIVSNRGFESLTRSVGGTTMWVANEEALTVDGSPATTTSGTTVRLQQLLVEGNNVSLGAQYAYQVEPIHANGVLSQRSGLVDLVALPDGNVLALERSFAALGSPTFLSRIYQIDFTGATDISQPPWDDGLTGQSSTPVAKELVASFTVGASGENLEGLALGPQLASGNWALIGVVDGGPGDPFSGNTIVSLEAAAPTCGLAGDFNCNGTVDHFDYATWRDTFGSTAFPFADANNDGAVGAADYTVWRDNLGTAVATQAAVPEPCWFWLLAEASLLAACRRKRHAGTP